MCVRSVQGKCGQPLSISHSRLVTICLQWGEREKKLRLNNNLASMDLWLCKSRLETISAIKFGSILSMPHAQSSLNTRMDRTLSTHKVCANWISKITLQQTRDHFGHIHSQSFAEHAKFILIQSRLHGQEQKAIACAVALHMHQISRRGNSNFRFTPFPSSATQSPNESDRCELWSTWMRMRMLTTCWR